MPTAWLLRWFGFGGVRRILRDFFSTPRTPLRLPASKVVAECIGEPIRAAIRLGFFVPHNVRRECGSQRLWSSRLPVEIFSSTQEFKALGAA